WRAPPPPPSAPRASTPALSGSCGRPTSATTARRSRSGGRCPPGLAAAGRAPAAPPLPPGAAGTGAVATGTRPVHWDGDWHDTPVVARGDLGAGDQVRGPGVVEGYGWALARAPRVRG